MTCSCSTGSAGMGSSASQPPMSWVGRTPSASARWKTPSSPCGRLRLTFQKNGVACPTASACLTHPCLRAWSWKAPTPQSVRHSGCRSWPSTRRRAGRHLQPLRQLWLGVRVPLPYPQPRRDGHDARPGRWSCSCSADRFVSAKATGNGNNRIYTVTWTDNSKNETAFVIERSSSPTGPWSVLTRSQSDRLTVGPGTGTRTYVDRQPGIHSTTRCTPSMWSAIPGTTPTRPSMRSHRAADGQP
jgi:hypothetical protein